LTAFRSRTAASVKASPFRLTMRATDPAAQYVLNADELESLRELTHGSVRRRISSKHAAKLVELGYARETADGVTITHLGRALLATKFPDWPADSLSV
jgi:hypothetical protein